MNQRKINKALSLIVLPALGGAFLAVGAAPSPAHAQDLTAAMTPMSAPVSLEASGSEDATELAACQNVTIRVKNNKSVKIKVLKMEYKSREDGKWRNESLPNEVISAGDIETVKSGAALEYVEGHKMTSIRLHYKKWCGGKWSVTYKTTDSTFDKAKCVYGKTYRIDTSGGGC